jgi:ribose/xylose/arabinose/galactoside ABC-type transport system permease subunit
VDVYWQTFVIGATLLAAVLIDQFGKIRRDKLAMKKAGN